MQSRKLKLKNYFHDSSTWDIMQNQPPDVLHKKGVLKNFVKFTRKHLRQSLLSNKVAGLNLQLY